MMQTRYSRQILFTPIGLQGQQKLERATVGIVGCGALGSVGAEMLARAGVGRIVVVDRDFVEESNLQRQSLFTERDAREGIPKAVAAQKALQALNTRVAIDAQVEDVTCDNIESLYASSDVIIDGTDNFETRYLVNDFSVKSSRPWVYGACLGSRGVSFAFRPGKTLCLQCLFGEPPEPGSVETCDTVGIVAPAVHLVASFQVTQVLKLLTESRVRSQILEVDLWEDRWRLLPVRQGSDGECGCCHSRCFRFLEGGDVRRTIRLCGRNAVQVSPPGRVRLDFDKIARRLKKTGKVRFNQYTMQIFVGDYEIALFPDGRSIIRGTEDFSEARGVYSKYVGS